MKTGKAAAIALAFGLFAGTAFGQQQPSGRGPEQFNSPADPGTNWQDMSDEQREEIGKKIEALKVMRMTEALNLDDKGVRTFIPAITSLEKKRRDLMRDNHRTIRDMKQELAQKTPDQSKLKSALDRVYQNHQEMVKLRDREFAVSKEYLTVEQRARLVIFQQEFMREIRGMLSGARGNGMGMGKGAGPGGMQREPLKSDPPMD